MKVFISLTLLLTTTLLPITTSSAQRLGFVPRTPGPVMITPPIVLTPNTLGGLSLESTLPEIKTLDTDKVLIYQDNNRDLKAVVIPPSATGAGSGDGGGPDCEDECKRICHGDISCVNACMKMKDCTE